MSAGTQRRLRRLVLVGGGHTHVQVLRAFAMDPPPDTRLTVVLDRAVAVYSGMVPGYVAGQYGAHELEIDVVPLARRAGARVVLEAALSIDPSRRLIHVGGRPPIGYDVASVDIGSTVAGLDLPGIADLTLRTRPIGRFVQRLEPLLEAARGAARRPYRLLVVGGGAGGVEVTFTLAARLRREDVEAEVVLMHGGDQVLDGYPRRLVRRVEKRAAEAGVALRCEQRVARVERDGDALAVYRQDGGASTHDAVAWVAGAVAQPLWRTSDLTTDARGFVWTRPSLQVEGHDDLFAVGDCATLRAWPDTPKAGVYAVRQGPVLIANLRARLGGDALRTYRPQSDFLTLLNVGDGTAIGARSGLVFEGRWVMRWKDRIDRRFMQRFQVLGENGAPNPDFEPMPGMGDGADGDAMSDAMFCGGCAAKLGQHSLGRVLASLPAGLEDESVVLGLAQADDAAAVRLPGGDVLVSSVDAFRAFCDDPYQVGLVGAANALSDLWAKGVRPRWAHAVVTIPQDEPEAVQEETLGEVMAGLRTGLDPHGVTLVGGHTMTGPELVVGLVVDGVAPTERPLLSLDRLRVGDRVILTKALGTGVLFHADMLGRAAGAWIVAALRSMARPNADAARIAVDHGATAATDVTGFGLFAHARDMALASGCGLRLDVDRLPSLDGAVNLLQQGLRSTVHAENARGRRLARIAEASAEHPCFELLFDPQTSGGLLFGVDPASVDAVLAALHEAGDGSATVIGRAIPRPVDGADMLIGSEDGPCA